MSVEVNDQRPTVENEEDLSGKDSTNKKELNCKHQTETEVFSGPYNKAIQKHIEITVKQHIATHRKETMMKTGIMSLCTFFLGSVIFYNKSPDNIAYDTYTNYTSTVIAANENSSHTSMGTIQKEFLQCQANYTQILANLTNMQYDQLLLRRDLRLLEGNQNIHSYTTISYFEGIIALIVCGVIEGLVFLFLLKQWTSGQNTAHQITEDYNESNYYLTNSTENQMRPRNLLDQVHGVQLSRTICIISFYKETQILHQKLVKSAVHVDIPIKPFLMLNHEKEITCIPRSKFIFIFVDFNERNVILENPGQDLGDKKSLTVEAAQKMGADVFVVYVRDRGSTELPDGQLYNSNLSGFTRHSVLKPLTARGRGLSVYETFTNYQKNHIDNVISK